ncbi:MAG: helix-turn-helix domain-containing protein [Bacteroidota bacterium]
MYSFPELIKKIRNEAGLTQTEFAKALGVSAVLIAMVETGQKEVSKNLLVKIAEQLNVHPFSITPFLFIDTEKLSNNPPAMEKKIIEWGEKMQTHLIKDRAKLLKKYAN